MAVGTLGVGEGDRHVTELERSPMTALQPVRPCAGGVRALGYRQCMDTDPEGAAAEPFFPAKPTEYARAGAEWFSDTVRVLAEVHHPFIGSFQRQFVEEFPEPDDEEEDETAVDFRQFVHQHEMHVSLDTPLTFDVGTMLAHADALADSLGGQQSRDMIRMISDAATATGNVITIDLDDPVEQYISGLAAADIEFDEDGAHNLQIVGTKEFFQRLSDNPPTAEQQERIDALFKAKKEAQDARRNHRRIP